MVGLASDLLGVEVDDMRARKESFVSDLEMACRKFNRVKKESVLQTYFDGWIISHNLFGRRLVSSGRSPGQLAGVEAPFRNWADVVRQEGRLSISAP